MAFMSGVFSILFLPVFQKLGVDRGVSGQENASGVATTGPLFVRPALDTQVSQSDSSDQLLPVSNESETADLNPKSASLTEPVFKEPGSTDVDAADSTGNESDSDQIAHSDGIQSVEKEPYDPIKENGVYFTDWEKPDLAIVLTGLMNGYIEPCGCAGMDRMKGGLSRRCTFIRELESMGWPVLAVDGGQIADGFGVQEEMKFDMAFNAFRLMKYQAVGIGKNELRFPAFFLLSFTAPSSNDEQSLFVSANVGIYGFHAAYTIPYKVIEKNGFRIGVTSVVFPDADLEHRDENILIEPPAKKLQEIIPALRKAKCDKLILIVHGTEAESTDLAAKFPDFDFVLCSDGPSEPPAEIRKLNNKQSLVEVGEKGKFAIVLGLYNSSSEPMRYQRVALDSRYEASREIHMLMEEYQKILKTLVVEKGYKEGLGLSLIESPQFATQGKYVGSAKCESCHEEAFRVWRHSKHSTAWQSLTQTASPPRDFDPECISCHVVGWHGIENFPYSGGFKTEAETPQLMNVGCECCHGPGEKHMAAELEDDTDLQDQLRASMRLGDNVKKVCFSCHDGDNSPEFNFDTYYPLIEHKETEE